MMIWCYYLLKKDLHFEEEKVANQEHLAKEVQTNAPADPLYLPLDVHATL
jgi:hypothetical protein